MLVSGLMVATGAMPSPVRAGGVGGKVHPHGRRWGMRTSEGTAISYVVGGWPSMPAVATTRCGRGSVLAGMNGISLPMVLVPAVVDASLPTAVGAPASLWVLVGPSSATPPLGLGGTTAPAPSEPAGLSAPGQARAASGTDVLDEYCAFVAAEGRTPAAAAHIAPEEVARFAPLSDAVGGPDRLASIGRFLKARIGDPNLRSKARDLFGRFAGAAQPRSEPLIDAFLDALTRAAADAVMPPPSASVVGPPGPLATPGGELRVRVTFENAPPPAPNPGSGPVSLDSIEAVATGLGATILTKDATGIKIRKPDGGIVKFGPDGRIRPY